MTIFDDIRKDLERGTPGDWVADGWDQDKICGKGIFDHEIARKVETGRVDARRIARVPQLERIALAAEKLGAVIDEMWLSDQGYFKGMTWEDAAKVDEAIHKFNKAIK